MTEDFKPEITEDMKRPFQKGDMKHKLLEESSFAVLFPHYREKYLLEIWPRFEQALAPLGIIPSIDPKEGILSVRTSDETWDPVSIIKCRDAIRLLARSVPLEQALRVLEDGVEAMVLVIGRNIRNVERFAKRRQRLVGPNGDTLKALELLTGCYILVQGHTVAAVGSESGLATVQRVAQDCMNNIHPVYHIKTLMVKRELSKNPDLANEDWDRFLPKFKKMTKSKKKKVKREKRNRSALPAYPVDGEIDKKIESGEYFRKTKSDERRKKRKRKERDTVQEQAEAPPEERRILKESEAKRAGVASAMELADAVAGK